MKWVIFISWDIIVLKMWLFNVISWLMICFFIMDYNERKLGKIGKCLIVYWVNCW